MVKSKSFNCPNNSINGKGTDEQAQRNEPVLDRLGGIGLGLILELFFKLFRGMSLLALLFIWVLINS